MSRIRKLCSHPRLFVAPGGPPPDRRSRAPHQAFLNRVARTVAQEADRLLARPPLKFDPASHNALLIRARRLQNRVLILLIRYGATGDPRYRAAAVDAVREMGGWDGWSWITTRVGNTEPTAIFDLSYGENSATLAFAFDWLHKELTEEERRTFLDIARRWSFASGLVHCRRGGASWFGRPDSNWNTVCAGGLGMLCLALYDHAPEARRLLPRVEASVAPYMRALRKTDGAWPEGIGYWNYGMRYAFWYLLSHERATGARHPLLRGAYVRRTLAFPLDFSPHGQGCSFGDVNRFAPCPFHYAAAHRLGAWDVCQQIEARLAKGTGGGKRDWGEPLWLLVPRDRTGGARGVPASAPEVRLYRGQDWAALRERPRDPALFASVRGGSTRVPHAHLDLLSFHVVVRGEHLVGDVKPSGYMDSTFSGRRWDLFEMQPASKNTLLVNGVGIIQDASLDRTERVRLGDDVQGVRLEATSAMGASRDGHPAVTFCGRVMALVGDRALLVVDRVSLPFPGRVESRMHAFAGVRATADARAVLRGRKASLSVAWASTVPAVLRTGVASPTDPQADAPTVLRWCTSGTFRRDVVFAAVMAPGAKAVRCRVHLEGRHVVVDIAGRGRPTAVRLTARLRAPVGKACH